jgi:hypothetical protein
MAVNPSDADPGCEPAPVLRLARTRPVTRTPEELKAAIREAAARIVAEAPPFTGEEKRAIALTLSGH